MIAVTAGRRASWVRFGWRASGGIVMKIDEFLETGTMERIAELEKEMGGE